LSIKCWIVIIYRYIGPEEEGGNSLTCCCRKRPDVAFYLLYSNKNKPPKKGHLAFYIAGISD